MRWAQPFAELLLRCAAHWATERHAVHASNVPSADLQQCLCTIKGVPCRWRGRCAAAGALDELGAGLCRAAAAAVLHRALGQEVPCCAGLQCSVSRLADAP